VAEALSKIKVATSDNRTLLSYDNRGLTIAGLPVVISRHVDATTKAWGVSASRNRTVLRKGTEIAWSKDTAFATTRSTFAGWPVWASGSCSPLRTSVCTTLHNHTVTTE
jgi:hypothetical protein